MKALFLFLSSLDVVEANMSVDIIFNESMVYLISFSLNVSRIPFTMLVLQKAVKMVWELPEVMRVAYAFVFVMLCWLVIWTFGVAGTISLSADDGARWWLLLVSGQVFTSLVCQLLQTAAILTFA